ncbi:MAG: hypothetical protein ACRDHI_07205 [Actinomycetota bacterium]
MLALDIVRWWLWLVIPGLGLSLVASTRSELSALSRLALAAPIGFASVGLVGLALAVLGWLTPTTASVAWIAVSIAAWVVAVRRGGVSESVDRLRREVRSATVAVSVGVGVLVVFLIARSRFGVEQGFLATPLRYWADGLEIADAGRVPPAVLHWGVEVPPTVSKVVMNMVYAQASHLMGRDPLDPLAAGSFVVAVSVALVLVALAWELGIRRLALAFGVLLVAGASIPMMTLAGDLRLMVAENWGRLLALAALIPMAVALRSEGGRGLMRPLPILAGALLGAAAGTHLVAALAGALAVMGLGAGRGLVDRRLAGAAAASVLGAGVVSIALAGTIFLAAGGDLGFQGASGDRSYDAVRDELGLPESFDPVVFLVSEGRPARMGAVPSGPGEVVQALASKFLGAGRAGEGSSTIAAFAVAAVATLLFWLVWRSKDADLRAVGLGSVLFAAGLVAVAIGFAARYDTFALANFGSRRLVAYFALAFFLLLAAGAEGVLSHLPERAGTQVGLIVGVALFAALVPGLRTNERPTLRDDLGALAWLRRHVPPEGRILVDRRTLATLEVMTGRAGVVEGMGPHVRPSLLVTAVREMLDARSFFRDPWDGLAYLRSHGVAAVVTTTGSGVRFGGWGRYAEPSPGRLERVPFLREAYRNDGVAVFLVDGWHPPVDLPTVAGRPGFA